MGSSVAVSIRDAHDFLGHVRRVGILQPVALAMSEDQRRVELHKFAPRLRVLHIAQAQEQTGACNGSMGTGDRVHSLAAILVTATGASIPKSECWHSWV